ncbi:MAG: hypothetical protein WC619_00460 [Patescibacteria group bacterium]
MRIFLIWADKGLETKNLMLELKKHGHEIVYWVGIKGGEKDKLPETIFHEHWQAVAGLPAENIDMAEFSPPGEDLIEKLYGVESIILTMMNKRYDKMCVDERRHLYYNMLQYWRGIIEKYKPEVIIFAAIPHTIFNYLVYELAIFFGIKTIIIETTWVRERSLIYNDFWQGNNNLQQELKNNKGKNFLLTDLSDDLKEYYQLQTSRYHDATPQYMKEIKMKYSINKLIFFKARIIIRSLKDLTILKKVPLYFIKLFGQNIRKEYRSVQKKSNLAKKFIYVPLNYQPERTTSPQGGIFVDQILMVEILSAALPPDWVIYAKEHPYQLLARGLNFSSSRYPGYYRKIAKLKNVELIPVETNTYTLIDKSQAVATVTGTAGWEAILRSKPAITFGYPWYQDYPGVLKVNNVESCKKALQKVKDGFKIEQQQVINYLKSFDRASIYGYVDVGVVENPQITKQESIKNITQAILEEMEKIHD